VTTKRKERDGAGRRKKWGKTEELDISEQNGMNDKTEKSRKREYLRAPKSF
jgi:hypothetical protein